MIRHFLTGLAGYCLLFASLWPLGAAALEQRPAEISVGYVLNWPTPGQFAQVKNTFDFALDMKVNWVAFDNGNDMNAAMESGRIQIAYSQGHVPFIVGVSGGLDLTMIGITVDYAEIDNCVVHRDAEITMSTAPRLEGRKIAVQLGSLTHFKLLKVLAHLGVDAERVELVGVADGAAAAAALRQGEVVMACAAGRSLQAMSDLGSPLMSGAEQEAIGLRLFDVVAVPTGFMHEQPALVQAFMDVIEASNRQWRKNPEPMRAAIARAAGMDVEGASRALDEFSFPLAAEQKTAAWMGASVPAYTKEIADFFVAQGKLDKSLESYDRYISTRFLR